MNRLMDWDSILMFVVDGIKEPKRRPKVVNIMREQQQIRESEAARLKEWADKFEANPNLIMGFQEP